MEVLGKRGLVLALALGGGCLFQGTQTRGLPCNDNGECGPGQMCIARVCGGPPAGAASDTDDTEGDSSDGDDESSTGVALPPDDDDDVREECVPADTECLDGNTIRLCEEGKLHTLGCPGWCGEGLETIGCHYLNQERADACVCRFEIEACETEGARTCSGNGLGRCTGGRWAYTDCDEICRDAGKGYVGASHCDAGTCYCDTGACTEDAMRCVDSNTLAGCFGGTWQSYSCTEICQSNDYEGTFGCIFVPGEDSTCWCN